MQTDQNKRVVRRWIAFADAGFPGVFDEFIAADYVGHLSDAQMDLRELERLERAFVGSFPNMRHSIDDLIAERDRVVVRVTLRGTHRAEFQGIAPTHREVEFTGIVIYRLSGQKIAETWGNSTFCGSCAN
jgi:predicted ester cyclase